MRKPRSAFWLAIQTSKRVINAIAPERNRSELVEMSHSMNPLSWYVPPSSTPINFIPDFEDDASEAEMPLHEEEIGVLEESLILFRRSGVGRMKGWAGIVS